MKILNVPLYLPKSATTFLLTLSIIFNPLAVTSTMAETIANTLTVTGRGDRQIPTTKARVQIEVEVEAKTAQEVQSQVAERTDKVIRELKSINVEKLQTTNISLNPKIEYENNRSRQVGFVGQTSLSFVISIDRSGGALDRAIASGANRITQISFSAEDDAIRAARSLALQDAVKDAQLQANAVLSSLNLKSQSIRTIQVSGDSSQGFVTNRLLNQANIANTSTSIIGGDQRVQASVILEISYTLN